MISFFAPPRDGRGLTVCSECGAVVAHASQEFHIKWHAYMAAYFNLIEAMNK